MIGEGMEPQAMVSGAWLLMLAAFALVTLSAGCASTRDQEDPSQWSYNPNSDQPAGPGWYPRP